MSKLNFAFAVALILAGPSARASAGDGEAGGLAPASPVLRTEAESEAPRPEPSAAELLDNDLPAEAPGSNWAFSVGTGLASRWRRDVNPQFGNFKSSPLAFVGLRYARWSGLLETVFEPEQSSHAGSFNVRTTTMTFAGWARFDVYEFGGYRPFVSLGGGASLDRVRAQFLDRFDERAGSRRFLGLGAGVIRNFWTHVSTEFEGRVTSEELTRGPVIALILRVGLTF